MLADIQENISIKPTLYVNNASTDPQRKVGLTFELDGERLGIVITETKKGGRTYRSDASIEIDTLKMVLERLHIDTSSH